MSNKPNKSRTNIVKNPCKYCLTQVTNKNGLQCQGACKKWAHYKCLRYTPGKISDIKAGIIKVTCPCPGCETKQEKNYLANPPYTCSKQMCPENARGPAMCDSVECPANRAIVVREEQRYSTKRYADHALDFLNQYPPPRKSHPARLPSPRCSPIPKTYRPPRSASSSSRMSRNQKTVEMACTSSHTSFDACPNQNTFEYGNDGEDQVLMVNALQEMSGTVGMLSKQIRELMCKVNKMVESEGSEKQNVNKTE